MKNLKKIYIKLDMINFYIYLVFEKKIFTKKFQ